MKTLLKDLLWITKDIALTWWLPLAIVVCLFSIFLVATAKADELPSNEAIANAIYIAEGGAKTSHPYGVLHHYQHTNPRQACINTIKHARRDWNVREGDFIVFLGKRYCPVGASNDPNGLNRNWVRNVKANLT